jgi:AcrR family transcriptional regulator
MHSTTMNQSVQPGDLEDNRRDRRKREIRRRIIDATAHLFGEKGYEETTIEQICERADVSLMTFYNHFFSKQQLANVLCEIVLFEDTDRRIQRACEHSPHTLARLEHFILGTAEQIRNYHKLERNLVRHLLQQASLDADEATRSKLWDYPRQALSELIQTGQRSGDLTVAFDPKFLAEVVAGSMDAIFINWVFDENYPIQDVLRELVVFVKQTMGNSVG